MAGSIRYRGGRLYPPGKRGRVWYWRGAIDGTRHEFSTGTGDREDAKRVVREALQERAQERADVPVTFEDVAEMYMDSRQSSKQERRFIARLVQVAGDKSIASIRQGDMTPVIQRFYPTAAAATINRQVFTPYAAITHYAADMDLCPYKRVRKMRVDDTFRMPAPNDLGQLLLANTEGHQRAYCAILYLQGWRQSDARRLEWPNVNLNSLTFTTIIPKSGRLKAVPMDPVARDALAILPQTEGKVFPWPSRDSVRRWWKPLGPIYLTSQISLDPTVQNG